MIEEEFELEESDEDATTLDEVYPFALKMGAGEMVILNVYEVAEDLGASAFQVLEDGSAFFMKEGVWHSIPVVINKAGPQRIK